jgi:DNA end-binding protein Ku
MLVTLRHAEEVLSPQELPGPRGRALDAKELKMAEQLVAALEDEFRPDDFRDEYRRRVLEFIEKKAAGKAPRLRPVREKAPPKSLAGALAASLKAARRQKEKAAA